MASKHAGRSAGIARGRIAHDAEAFAAVVARHGGKPGGGRSAEYADRSLTPHTLAVRVVVAPKDASRLSLGRFAYDTEAFAAVISPHGGRSGAGRCAEYADCALTPDTMSVCAGVTPEDAGHVAACRYPHDAEDSSGILRISVGSEGIA